MENQTPPTQTDSKLVGVISYLTPIGLILAFVLNNPKRQLASFHIRQSLGIFFLGFVCSVVPFVNSILWIIPLVAWVYGFVGAVEGKEKVVPYIGDYFQDWFRSL